MKKLHFLFSILAAIWLFGCQKDPPITTIKGRITEFGTDKPIESAIIYLLCYGGGVFGGSSSSLGDTILTDANGEFHREYPQEDVCGGAYMIVHKAGYFKRDGLGVTTGVNDVNIALDPGAWLKIVAVPDLGGNNLSVSGSDFYGGSGFDFSASEGTSERTFYTTGNRVKHLRWYINSQPNYTQDSVYLSGMDTTSYTIHY